jgi:hypothetical protein
MGIKPNSSLVGPDDLTANSQSQASALRVVLSTYLHEFIEDPGLIFIGDSFTVISHREVDLAPRPFPLQVNATALRAMADGISQQV